MLRAGRAGSDKFTVLNDSASPKMIMKIYFSFSDFFKRFGSCLNAVEATYKWLLMGASFVSFTRNDKFVVIFYPEKF